MDKKKEKAKKLINAYFDGKDLGVKDVLAGINHWTSIKDPRFWTYLGKFCENVDKYKIVEDECRDA